MNQNRLYHHGIKGQKWGKRNGPPYPLAPKDRSALEKRAADQHSSNHSSKNSKLHGVSKGAERLVYSVGAKINPREVKYAIRKLTNNPDHKTAMIAKYTEYFTKSNGYLPNDHTALKAVESMGIERHRQTKYDNLSNADIKRLKTYTDSARYSRGINGYLAIGEPKEFADDAAKLKSTLSKNSIKDLTVYRSCNYKFSTNGLAKKLDSLSEKELANMFSSFSKNYNGKKLNENRVFSTSTSPLFAIDTWRSVNSTAAKTYNTYMIINCKGFPGVLADGRTTDGRRLVNTRSNQEAILAPNKLQYQKLEFDKERQMFVITVNAL